MEPIPEELPRIVWIGDYSRVIRSTTNTWHVNFGYTTATLHVFIDAATDAILCIYLTIEG